MGLQGHLATGFGQHKAGLSRRWRDSAATVVFLEALDVGEFGVGLRVGAV